MVYVFLADGFEEIEALTPVDLLRRAGVEVKTVSIYPDRKNVTGARAIEVKADITIDGVDTGMADIIVLPGGMPGSKNLDESRIVDSALRAASRKGAYLAAICAAPMVLGKRGYLEGKRAVCFPGFEEYLTGATIDKENTVVRDGNIVTAKGMGAAFDFGLELVRCFKDDETAEKIRNSVFAK